MKLAIPEKRDIASFIVCSESAVRYQSRSFNHNVVEVQICFFSGYIDENSMHKICQKFGGSVLLEGAEKMLSVK